MEIFFSCLELTGKGREDGCMDALMKYLQIMADLLRKTDWEGHDVFIIAS